MGIVKMFEVADLFCGAGGSSSGAARAIAALGGKIDLVCVNHWSVAIATHTQNHPYARHHCVDLDAARPEELVPRGHLDLLMASPECVFFSRARGGKPVNDQRRMSAWHVQRWASALDITCILVENVPEFRDWGPLTSEGKPDPKKKGVYFEAWIKALWLMGYVVEWKLLNAADFGGATTRTRFFLQARKDGRPIRWPTATHSPTGSNDLFGGQQKWRAAREVIDWGNPGRSILGRKKPLSEKTRRRIARGLQRFGGALAPYYIRLLDLDDVPVGASAGEPTPFVMANRGSGTPRHIDSPTPTITTLRSWNVGVVEPTLEPFHFGNRNNAVPKSANEPLPTATTSTGGGIALVEPTVEPFVLSRFSNDTTRAVDEPLPTVVGRGAGYLVEPTAEPFVLGQQSGSAPRSTDEPLPTVAAAGAISLVKPLITPYYGNGKARSADEPLPTVTTKDRFAVCSPIVVPYGPRSEARDVDEPLPTILTKDRLGLATPMVVPFYGEKNGQARAPRSCDEPLATITTEPRFGLCVADAEAFIVPQFGEHPKQAPRVHALEDPLPTVTGHGAGALVSPVLDEASGEQVDPRRLVLIEGRPYLLDIRFRMLTNKELARAMGFDVGDLEYQFTGTTEEVTRQIGNAVECHVAEALVRAILGD